MGNLYSMTARFFTIGGLFLGSAISVTRAGTIVEQGTLHAWGSPLSFSAWDVYSDVSGGFSLPYEGTPFGMTFNSGSLYVANRGEGAFGVGFSYAPGAGGNLATATPMRTTGIGAGDSRRFVQTVALTANTSGGGYGAGGLVGLGLDFGAPTGRKTYVVSPSGPNWALGELSSSLGNERDLDYVSSIDRFATVTNDQLSAQASIRQHDSGGLTTSDRIFDLAMTDLALHPISGAFASRISGMTVADAQVLLVAGSPNLLGTGEELSLSIWTLAGVRLGQAQTIAHVGVPSVKSVAVDESAGNIYIGGVGEVGSGGGFISVIRVPCPSSVMVLAGFAGMVGSGRRRATVRS